MPERKLAESDTWQVVQKVAAHVVIIAAVCIIFAYTWWQHNLSHTNFPIARSIVLHTVTSIGHKNHLWRLFGQDTDDLFKRIYETNAKTQEVTPMQIIKYSAGCFASNDQTVKEKTWSGTNGYQYELVQPSGTHGAFADNFFSENAQVKTTLTTSAGSLVLKKPLYTVAVDDFVRIGADEIVKVTDINPAKDTLTIERGQHGTSPKEALVDVMVVKYRHAPADQVSVCACLTDVDNILASYNNAADKAKWLDDYLGKSSATVTKIKSQYGEHSTEHKNVTYALNIISDDIKEKNTLETFKRKAVDSCFANYAPEFTSKYNGALETARVIRSAIFILLVGILVGLVTTAYVPEKQAGKAGEKIGYKSVNDLVSNVNVNGKWEVLQALAVMLELTAAGVLLIFNFVYLSAGDDDYFPTSDPKDEEGYNSGWMQRVGTFSRDWTKSVSTTIWFMQLFYKCNKILYYFTHSFK